MSELLIIGALGAFAYYLYGKNNITPQTSGDKALFPLKVGDTNIFVTNLQKAMMTKGGSIASLIQSSGGVTGYFNSSLQTALRMLGYPEQISETHYREIVNDNSQLRNIAYVIDLDGAKAFKSTGTTYDPNYGYGRELLLTMPVKTYLGKTTGNYKGSMMEIVTTINTQTVKFWVDMTKVALVSESEYSQLKDSTIIPKSDEVKLKLL